MLPRVQWNSGRSSDGKSYLTRPYFWKPDRCLDLHYRTLDVDPDDEDGFYRVDVLNTSSTLQDVAFVREVAAIEDVRRIGGLAKHARKLVEIRKRLARWKCACSDLEIAFRPHRAIIERIYGRRIRRASAGLEAAFEPYRLKIVERMTPDDQMRLGYLGVRPNWAILKKSKFRFHKGGRKYPAILFVNRSVGDYHEF